MGPVVPGLLILLKSQKLDFYVKYFDKKKTVEATHILASEVCLAGLSLLLAHLIFDFQVVLDLEFHQE